MQRAKERAATKELDSIRALVNEKRKILRKAQGNANEQIDSYLQMRDEIQQKIENKLHRNIQDSQRENLQIKHEEGIILDLDSKVKN